MGIMTEAEWALHQQEAGLSAAVPEGFVPCKVYVRMSPRDSLGGTIAFLLPNGVMLNVPFENSKITVPNTETRTA